MKTQNLWHYKFVDLNTNENGLLEVLNFINENGPSGKDGIKTMLLGGNEFNIWVREDKSSLAYRFIMIPYNGDGKVLYELSNYFMANDCLVVGVTSTIPEYPIIVIA
jgi:hypothetical protein